LQLCAPRLRRWEWDRLSYLCHLDARTIPAPGSHAGSSFLCWSPDGTRLASMTSIAERPAGGWRNDDYHENAQIIDMSRQDGRVVRVPKVRKAAWDSQGRQLLVYMEDETLARVDANTGETTRLWILPADKLGVWGIAWSPDGHRVAVSRSRGTGSYLRVWDSA